MAWIDSKKAFDMMPHSWFLKCLNRFGVADNLSALIESNMNGWKTELTAGGKVIGKVNINRGIFPLTLVLNWVQLGRRKRSNKPPALYGCS